MDRRKVALVLMCLVLSGYTPCASQVVQRLQTHGEQTEVAERRAREIQKECIALKGRLITIEEEYAFGGAVSVNWVSQGGGLLSTPDAEALHTQLNLVGRHLAAQSSRPHLAWTFGVLASPGINAVSGPGGYVFVSEGLLLRLGSEAELAGVLAHEIAHITRKHALDEYQSYLVDECLNMVEAERSRPGRELGAGVMRDAMGEGLKGLAQSITVDELRGLVNRMVSGVNTFDFDKAGDALIQAITNGFVSRLAEKGFQERDEYVADRDAVALMIEAGYDPQAYITFLGKLPDKGLSTGHPRKGERQDKLRALLDTQRKEAAAGQFTSSVDPSQLKNFPLRGALLAHQRSGTTASR